MGHLIFLIVLNGISYGMLLFILTAGFTLVLGTMGIVHLAYGAFYLLGVYLAFTATAFTGNYFLGILIAAFCLGMVGIVVQWGLLSRIPKRVMPQVLLTFGIIPVIVEGTRMIWGLRWIVPDKPALLAGSIKIGTFVFPHYRLALIFAGCLIYLFLWLFLEKTTWGAILRAGRDDPEMSEGIGLNIPRIWIFLFGLGSLMAGLAAGLGGPYLPAMGGVEWEVLIMVFVVIVIGGIGNLKGAFVASVLIGILDNLGKAVIDELSMFLIFLFLVIILVIKPSGLFGKRGA